MSVLQWSSPLRKSGKKTLPPIPNEIYLEIFYHVKSRVPSTWIYHSVKRDLSNIALVCRFFCAVALPWISERQEIVGAPDNPSTFQSHASFCRSILKRDTTAIMMAQNVKSCVLSSWLCREIDKDMEWIFAELLSIYSKAISFMSNIRELDLSLTPISKGLIKTLTNLPHLESLSLQGCLPSEKVTSKYLRKLPSLSLKSFIVSSTDIDHDDWWLEFYRQINLESVVNLTTNSWRLCKRLMEINSTLALENFDICAVNDFSVLAAILSKSPSLKVFRSLINNSSPGHPLTLDAKALPHLRHLGAPISILKALVPGRPVSTVEISKCEQLVPQSDLECLKSSLRPVTHLVLPAGIYDCDSFSVWQQFPHITTLKILLDITMIEDTRSPESVIESRLSRLLHTHPKQTLLRTFILDCNVNFVEPHLWDLHMQHRWLVDLVLPQFSGLRQYQINSAFEWFYCPIEAKWGPQIVPNFCQGVIKWARLHQQLDDVDYEGFLKRLVVAAE